MNLPIYGDMFLIDELITNVRNYKYIVGRRVRVFMISVWLWRRLTTKSFRCRCGSSYIQNGLRAGLRSIRWIQNILLFFIYMYSPFLYASILHKKGLTTIHAWCAHQSGTHFKWRMAYWKVNSKRFLVIIICVPFLTEQMHSPLISISGQYWKYDLSNTGYFIRKPSLSVDYTG